jgi:hypothetical protein
LNLKTGESTITHRRNIKLDVELPMGDAYASAIRGMLNGGEFNSPLTPPTNAFHDPT